MNELEEVQDLINRLSNARKMFNSNYSPAYRESAVKERYDVVSGLLSIFINDAITMKHEWEMDMKDVNA